MLSTARIFGAAALLVTGAGLAYMGFAIKRIRDFRRTPVRGASTFTPPVTIFKPLHGDEPRLYENLRSFCDQDYRAYQVIFGAANENDPAIEIARRLQREFSKCDIAIVAGSQSAVRNPKVGNLIAMREHAKHEIFLIADSDMHAGRDYLRAVMAPFEDAGVGAVTCIYGGNADSRLPSQLGAMHVNDQFVPSVLVATALEPLTYCFGATMAVRRDVLERIGGFEELGRHLGDDYTLGKLVAEAGYGVELSPYVVHTTVAEADLASLWLHELRWARTILAQRPAGYTGSVVTFPLPFAAAFAALVPSTLGIVTLVLTIALRTLLHFEAGRTFAPHVRATPWLIPLRDGLGLGVWFAAFLGKRVRWRDSRYEVKAGGHMAARD
jgi:ceramide glucosyltransferase